MTKYLVVLLFIVNILGGVAQEQIKDSKEQVVLEMVVNILDVYDMDLSMLMEYDKIKSVEQDDPVEEKRKVVLEIVMDMAKLYDIDIKLLLNSDKIDIKK